MTTTPRPPGALPGLDALQEVCRCFGVDTTGPRLLHHRSNAVYLLPREQIVVRMAPNTPLRRQRATTVITVSRWLSASPDPIALAPLPGHQPVIGEHAVATFWPHKPTSDTPTPSDLARLLRRLHALPHPPFPVSPYQPLHRLHEALTLDQNRSHPALTHEDQAWLRDRTHALVETVATTDFPLGTGLVHGDAHPENLLHDGTRWVLIDWDQACLGPRELDLVLGLPDHFHEPEHDRRKFLNAYGYDLTQWPQWTLLRDLSELHSLASYIRLAPSKPAAAHELDTRIRSLRTGDTTTQWRSISGLSD
ncbi:aminoglycoside phosphotransferase [Longimycelium tulufanense]|uniref:Aminoglycoside phosphotransferase n=1 Tax=Longimycelium tulufanense TaxID=907463 RepID=A0A8J3CL24_9PSEU|nr:aminoglycoside phosphotransferase family protein [Longimycelium tulufanense]GGM85114.1 aminoglycoside phosphotransferase [Longimycelium tulufanense]